MSRTGQEEMVAQIDQFQQKRQTQAGEETKRGGAQNEWRTRESARGGKSIIILIINKRPKKTDCDLISCSTIR